MKLILIIFIFSFNSYASLSYGTGTDNCNWSANDTKTQNVFNCDFVDIPGGVTIDFSSSSYIVIRSQGDVTIDGTLDLSGSGNSAGPGGTTGGVCPGPPTFCNAVDGASQNGGQGVGGGAGDNGGGGGNGSGGGGSGASFGAADATSGAAGTATGGTLGTAGVANNNTYFPEINFITNFTGGAGGGAGGSGQDAGGVTAPGGSGGGGGGAVIIIAKGLVTINGSILANGGNGLVGVSGGAGAGGGGGGGGTGGAIYIIGRDGVDNFGTVNALGGSGGAGGAGTFNTGGAGGNGGIGRVRIDTPTGSHGGGASNPASYQAVLPYIIDPLLDGQTFESDIEYACSYRNIEESNFFLSLIFGFLMALLILGISKALHRLRYYFD